jgi:lipopolysaccharide export system protein LptA
MPQSFALHRCLPVAAFGVALCLSAGGAWAEKADRTKPMVIEADRSATVDYQRQVLVYTGNVVITQGTMVLRAERVEMRETPDGHRSAQAVGSAGKPATWRQRRDGLDEHVEGAAERIDYDGRTDTLRLRGQSTVRRLRGATVVDEVRGQNIVWDNTAEVIQVEGGAPTADNPGGRVRTVLSPRAQAPAAPATTPSAAHAASASSGAATGGLAPVRQLGDRR